MQLPLRMTYVLTLLSTLSMWFSITSSAESIARIWNEQNISAIRIDFPNPPVHARNLFHTSVAMWDAWAAYDATAIGYIHRETATSADDLKSAREEAISYAAYRILAHRYAISVNATTTLPILSEQMNSLGYDPSVTSTVGGSPAAVGNRVAEAILAFAATDNSNENELYNDPNYFPINSPLIILQSGASLNNPNRWQPLAFSQSFTQNGLVAGDIQTFIGSQWGAVRPFAISLAEGETVYFDPGLPPQIGGDDDAEYKAGNLEVIRYSKKLDPSDGNSIDLSPSLRGNNPLGTNNGTGHPLNPTTNQPYPSNLVPHGDYGRVTAEFWADGPDSETPPGHWNILANEVTDHPGFERRMGGQGPILSPLEWDVKLYFALNAANHDVAVAVWGCKNKYDYIRPISSIRYMAVKGQSSDPNGSSYDPHGWPLEPGLVEQVTIESAAVGERHNGFSPGEIVLNTWGGEPADPNTQFTGAKWIRADSWLPYQRDTFVTPAFAGYVSGHSAFSRAAAEVLTSVTGSPYFPEGLGTFTAPKDAFLKFEQGPSVDVQLQWATFYDAADEAGLSRIYGGIHVPADDGPGRVVGSHCGLAATALASRYFDGSILTEPLTITYTDLGNGSYKLSSNALRGLFYRLEYSTDMKNFTSVGNYDRAKETTYESTITPQVEQRLFIRITQSSE